MSYAGMGKHTWVLQDGQVLEVLECLFIATAIYPLLLALIKISIVLLYLGIFPSRGFQIAVWVVVGFIAISGLAMELFALLTCSPVEYSWNKDIKPGGLPSWNASQWDGCGSGRHTRRGCCCPSSHSSQETSNEEKTKTSCHGFVLFGSPVSCS